MSEHDELLDTAGAWVLGALDEEEAWRYAAHLEVCATCRTEVARLQVAADALPLGAPAVAPPVQLRRRLLEIVEAEAQERPREGWATRTRTRTRTQPRALPPRRSRWTAVALAACLAAVLGGLAGWAVRGAPPGPRLDPVSIDATKARDSTRAQFVQTGDHGVLRVWALPQAPAGRVYQVWIRRDHEPPTPDALLAVDRHGRGSVALLGDVRGASAVLVTDEPAGGSLVPTRQPVIVATPA